MAILGCRHQPLFGEAALHKEDAVAEVAKAIHPVWSLLVSQEVKGQCREREQGRTDDYGTPLESAPCTRAGLYLRGGPPNSVLCGLSTPSSGDGSDSKAFPHQDDFCWEHHRLLIPLNTFALKF